MKLEPDVPRSNPGVSREVKLNQKGRVLWDVALSNMAEYYEIFGRIFCLYFQGRKVGLYVKTGVQM